MSETLKLQLPLKPYCEWDNPDGYRHALIMNGNNPRLIVFIGGQSLNIDDPRIVYSVGAMVWRREVERLDKIRNGFWLKYNEYPDKATRGPYSDTCDAQNHAEAQEAAWRAEGGR